MDYEMAVEIWRQIRASALGELRQELVELAVRYARMRVDYWLAKPEQQRLLGADRSRCHDALIAKCDILARNMAQRGEDDLWRIQLGPDRKDIGDFACFLHAMLGVAAR
jgi:hypothetical protein